MSAGGSGLNFLREIASFIRHGLKNHVSPVRFWPSAQAKSLGNSALASATPSVVTMSAWAQLHSGVAVAIISGPFPTDWAHSPDPLIHSWRWLQPEAAFARAFYEETQAMIRDFKADLRRQFLGV